MKILGLDYGDRRIGVAVSDELGIAARGLATIVRTSLKRDLEELGKLIQSCGAEKIVIGYPLRLDGTIGIQCEKVDRFVVTLEKRFSFPIEKWDESFSTREAEDLMAEARVGRKKTKAAVDKLAAKIILQGYLDDQWKKHVQGVTRRHDDQNGQ